jgi:sec-independent protein translocase protein TatA
MTPLVPLFPGIPGGIELMLVLAVVVLLFGANKLPALARSSGQALGEFRRGRSEIERDLREGVATTPEAVTDTDAEPEETSAERAA